MSENLCSEVNKLNPGTCIDAGNVTVIDPAGSIKNNTVNHEDLVIYVSLTAKLKNKGLIEGTETKEINIAHLTPGISNNITEPFGKGFLTTDWTNIGSLDSQIGKDLESFGITNIDIEVGASFMPKIVIDFVDVRGATLFEQGSCSPYAAFFHQPWPVFELTVKGFYGYPAKYFLHLQTFNTKFNSQTGNYESRGEFVGYSYAFLSDILVGYILAAPYMEGSKDMLKTIYEEYIKTLGDQGIKVDFDPITAQNGSPITLFNLIKKLGSLEQGGETDDPGILDEIRSSTELKSLSEGDKMKTFLGDISSEVTSLKNDWAARGGTVDEPNNSLVWVDKANPKGSGGNTVKNDLIDLAQSYIAPEKSIYRLTKTYNDSINEHYSGDAEILMPYDIIKLEDNGDLTIKLLDFYNKKDSVYKKLEAKVNELRTQFNSAVNNKIKASLGFLPTIRNVFMVILANTELFLELLKKSSADAETYHKTNYEQDKIFFPTVNGTTDVSVSDLVYAWPKYIEPGTKGERIEKYPGKNPKFTDWPEVKFVEEFIKALVQMQKDISDPNNSVDDSVKYQGLPGYDNYFAINAMETPAAVPDSNNGYLNQVDEKSILKTIGERFITLTNFTSLHSNHLNTSLIFKSRNTYKRNYIDRGYVKTGPDAVFTHLDDRVTDDYGLYISSGIPFLPKKFGGKDIDASNNYSFTSNVMHIAGVSGYPTVLRDGYKTRSYMGVELSTTDVYSGSVFPKIKLKTKVDEMYKSLGKIEGYNFVNTTNNTKLIDLVHSKSENIDEFYNEILTSLGYTFNDSNFFYDKYISLFRYKEDIILNPKSTEDTIILKPDINEMDGEHLIKLTPCEGCMSKIDLDGTENFGPRSLTLLPNNPVNDELNSINRKIIGYYGSSGNTEFYNYTSVGLSRDLDLLNDNNVIITKKPYWWRSAGFKFQQNKPWLTVSDGLGDGATNLVPSENTVLPIIARRSPFSQIAPNVIDSMCSVELYIDNLFDYSSEPYKSYNNNKGGVPQYKYTTDGVAELTQKNQYRRLTERFMDLTNVQIYNTPELNDALTFNTGIGSVDNDPLTFNTGGINYSSNLLIQTEQTRITTNASFSLKFGWLNIIPSNKYQFFDDYNKNEGYIRKNNNGDFPSLNHLEVLSYSIPSSDVKSIKPRKGSGEFLFGKHNLNDSNSGNILTHTPFWQHNFPSKEVQSESTNPFVYIPVKTQNYQEIKPETYHTLDCCSDASSELKGPFYSGIRNDLDKKQSNFFYPDNAGNKYVNFNGNVLTTHNRDTFNIETDKGKIKKKTNPTNLNRSKAWKGSLAYLFLANQYHRPWTGTYTNNTTYLGPQSVFGSSSVTAKVPKHSILMLGSVLWRMRESGLLISDDSKWNLEPVQNTLTTVEGGVTKYVDPINVPRLPEKLIIVNPVDGSKLTFNTKHMVFPNNNVFGGDIKKDIDNKNFDKWNHSVRPPMASILTTLGSNPTDNTKLSIISFPNADEWPVLNIGMVRAIDLLSEYGEHGYKNPFKNQYKIFVPIMGEKGSPNMRLKNSQARYSLTEKSLDSFEDAVASAKKKLKNEYVTEDHLMTILEERYKKVDNETLLDSIVDIAPNFASKDESYAKLSYSILPLGDLNPSNKNRLNKSRVSKGKIGEKKPIQFDIPENPGSYPTDEPIVFTVGPNTSTFGEELVTDLNKTKEQDSFFSTFDPDKLDNYGYIQGYLPIGPDIWFLPTKVKELFIKEFEDFVGNFNEYENESSFDNILKVIDPVNFPKPKPFQRCDKALELQSTGFSPNDYRFGNDDLVPANFLSYNNVTTNTNKRNTPIVVSSKGGKGCTVSDEAHQQVKNWFWMYKTNVGYKMTPDLGAFSYRAQALNYTGPVESITGVYNELFSNGYYMSSLTPRTWWGEFPVDSTSKGVAKPTTNKYLYFNELELKAFLNGFIEALTSDYTNTKKTDIDLGNSSLAVSNVLAGTQDEDIRLAVYRSLKSVYDKWISSSDPSGTELGKLFYNPISSSAEYKRTLLDHFSFVDRANRDIGNKAIVDIDTIQRILENTTGSLYGLINDITDKSGFNFHALPNYVDLSTGMSTFSKGVGKIPNKAEILANMFRPLPTSETLRSYPSGPHFICMYVGGYSQNLDLTRGKDYNCLLAKGGNKLQEQGDSFMISDVTQAPQDLSSVSDESGGIVAFKVKFGSENQSHFIGINLDQTEHKNTLESLKAIELLSQAGGPTATNTMVSKGQSMYDVYLNRSYGCSVEAMGNMMIQPLQYFELENIPMFYGSYLITKVSHKITPHDVKTTFEGNRIPQTVVPTVEDFVTAFNLSPSDATGGSILGGGGGSGKCSETEPMTYAITNNGGVWGDIEKGVNIKLKSVSGNKTNGVGGGGKMLQEAVTPIQEMTKDLVTHLKKTGHKGVNGIYVTIGSTFREYSSQEKLCCGSVGCYKDGVKCAKGTAAPGKSMHGYGIAVDFQFYDKEGNTISIRPINEKTGKIGFESESYKWLFNNSPYYGFVSPYWARNAGSYDEYWHFEYHGKSAIDLMESNPKFEAWGTTERYSWKTNRSYFDFVKNPLDKNGKEYILDCGKNIISGGSGSDGNTGPITSSKSLIEVLKKAGYKSGTFVYELALIIGSKEGYKKGSDNRPSRNNNPGNLSGSDYKSIDPGVTLEPPNTKGERVFAKFTTPELGAKALVEKFIKTWSNGNYPATVVNGSDNQKITNPSKYRGAKNSSEYRVIYGVPNSLAGISGKGVQLSIEQFMYIYAPPSSNSTEKYINEIVNTLRKSYPNFTRTSKLVDFI